MDLLPFVTLSEGFREHCYGCNRPKNSCMCAHITPFATKTKFVILMHPKEFKKVKNNTGFFTHRSLTNSELFVGIDFSHHKQVNEIIASHTSFVLYPSKDALNISEQNPALKRSHAATQPMAFFLIDATWACSKKIFTMSQNLKILSHATFTTQKESIYAIKEQPEAGYLSTIESTLVVLESLVAWGVEQNLDAKLDSFLRPFEAMIAFQQECLASRSKQSVRFIPRAGKKSSIMAPKILLCNGAKSGA